MNLFQHVMREAAAVGGCVVQLQLFQLGELCRLQEQIVERKRRFSAARIAFNAQYRLIFQLSRKLYLTNQSEAV